MPVRCQHFLRLENRPVSFSSAPGSGAEFAQVQTDLGESALPLLFYALSENQRLVGREGQPAVVLDFLVELSRSPARIAQRQQALPRPLPFSDVAQDVDGGGQSHLLAHLQAG